MCISTAQIHGGNNKSNNTWICVRLNWLHWICIQKNFLVFVILHLLTKYFTRTSIPKIKIGQTKYTQNFRGGAISWRSLFFHKYIYMSNLLSVLGMRSYVSPTKYYVNTKDFGTEHNIWYITWHLVSNKPKSNLI